MERERRNGISIFRVEIHILGEAVGIEKIIARPSGAYSGQARGVEIDGDLITRAKDRVFVIAGAQ
jgi:hypothetical protein